jgi:hypothetical protein
MGMSGLSRQEQMPQPDANYAPQTSNGTTTEYFSKFNVFATFRSFGRLSSDYDEFNKTRTVPLNYALDHPWEKNFSVKTQHLLMGSAQHQTTHTTDLLDPRVLSLLAGTDWSIVNLKEGSI